jgi:uncharacterized protein YodC (DUF2158 family)
MAFSVGDIVQLKSGGPKMTVNDVARGDGKVVCVWFAGAKREVGTFEPATLQVVGDIA